MNNKLLIVDNKTTVSSSFIDSLEKNQKLYKGWDIFYCTKSLVKSKLINYQKNIDVENVIKNYITNYKCILIIKSSDTFVNQYKLDLFSQVLEFPAITNENCITRNSNTNIYITLKTIKNCYYKVIRTDIFNLENWQLQKLTYQYVDYLFLKKNDVKYKVDYVFPYVNCNDPVWYDQYVKYKNLESGSIEAENSKDKRYEKNYSTGLQRFRDSGLLKYAFRSIEKNLPFINNVHMIVSTKSQVPSWINQSKVDIITHDEFIPKDLLPTFSSSEIEMFLPFLPRVSEYFIYGNDDTYIMKQQAIQNWFFEGKPVTYSGIRPMIDSFSGDIFRHNDLMLVAPETMQLLRNSCLDQQHCPQPYVLSKMKECYKKYEKQILASCTRFRENTKNFNQHIYLGYNQFNNFLYQKKRLCLTTDISQYKEELDLKKYTCICMNDSDENVNLNHLKVFTDKINSFFPTKSKYEI